MARKGKSGRKGMLPHTFGGWVGFATKIAGGMVIAGPMIRAVWQDVQSGQIEQIPPDILYQYTGIGGGTWNMAQAGQGAASVGGGIFLVYLGKFLGKHLR